VDEPMLRIERGAPTVDELAALVGALLPRLRAGTGPAPAAASRWRASALPSVPFRPGVGAWRASGLPHR
jgi:hypothetical protein